MIRKVLFIIFICYGLWWLVVAYNTAKSRVGLASKNYIRR